VLFFQSLFYISSPVTIRYSPSNDEGSTTAVALAARRAFSAGPIGIKWS